MVLHLSETQNLLNCNVYILGNIMSICNYYILTCFNIKYTFLGVASSQEHWPLGLTITCLLGDSCKPSFATVTERGHDQNMSKQFKIDISKQFKMNILNYIILPYFWLSIFTQFWWSSECKSISGQEASLLNGPC